MDKIKPDPRPTPPKVEDANPSWLWWNFEKILIPFLVIVLIVAFVWLYG